MSLFAACASKLAASSATGWPENNGDLHWPHLPAPPASLSRGARFKVLHDGQATMSISGMGSPRSCCEQVAGPRQVPAVASAARAHLHHGLSNAGGRPC
jgi:hypothetical protein